MNYIKYFFDLSWMGVKKISEKYPNLARAMEMGWYEAIFLLLTQAISLLQGNGMIDLRLILAAFFVPLAAFFGRMVREDHPVTPEP